MKSFSQLALHRIAVKIAFFLNGFILANWVSRLPRIQEQYHADNGTIGLVLLSLSLGAVAAMPFSGWLIIRNGSRRITLVALIMYCALVPFIPFMHSVILLMVLYLVMGVFTGMLDVAMNAQAVMIELRYEKPIMTSFHAFFSIGMALGAACGTFFADLGHDIEFHFGIIAGCSLLSLVWVSRHLINDKPDPSQISNDPLFRIPNKTLLGVGVIAFCCMMGEGAMSEWSVNYMENITHSSKTLAPVALTAFAVAMTLGRVFGDRFRTLLGDTAIISWGGALSIAGLGLTLLFPLPGVAIAGFFLVGIGLSTIVPIAYSIAGNSRDLPSGVALAMVTTVGYAGFLFGPPIIGFIADLFTLRIGLAFVLFLFMIMTVLGFLRKGRNGNP